MSGNDYPAPRGNTLTSALCFSERGEEINLGNEREQEKDV